MPSQTDHARDAPADPPTGASAALNESAPYPISLSSTAIALLQGPLDTLVDHDHLPCAHLSLASPHGILFQSHAGVFDVLPLEHGESPRRASGDDVLWFASTTKLLTAICGSVLRVVHITLGSGAGRVYELI